MIALDASVLIAHLDGDDAHHERATSLLLGAVDELCASRLTLGEVLVGPARAGMLDVAIRAIDELGVTTVGLEQHAPSRLAELRAMTGLKMPDCCVLLAAEEMSAALATFDGRLARAARERGIETIPGGG